MFWILFALSGAISSTTHAVEPTEMLSFQSACTPKERWTFTESVNSEWVSEFRTFVSKRISPVRGFAEALALRRSASTPEARMFGEYWVSRALLDSKLVHIAWNGFNQIVSQPVQERGAAVQLAAWECLARIQEKHSALTLSSASRSRLFEFIAKLPASERLEPLWNAAGMMLRSQLAEGASSPELETTLKLLAGSGPHEAFARGLWSSYRSDHAGASANFEKFLSSHSSGQKLPEMLERYVDTARLMLARSYFSRELFDKASAELKRIQKSSNQLALMLSELAWAYLQDERFGEAVGTAMNLQAGGLKHTFAPEAPMVMAMAMNEICQFPESIKAIRIFQKNYEASHNWLRQNRGPFYPQAVAFLRKQSQVPDKVGTEWVRSPLFISHQQEINLLFEEAKSTSLLSRAGAAEQKRMKGEILRLALDIKKRILAAQAKKKEIPQSVRNDLTVLKTQVTHYNRFRLAAPVWRTILKNYEGVVPKLERSLVARIEADLSKRSSRMLVQLEEIAENIQLIEVEIYNGASQDIIWQNAHPDYKEVAQKMKDDTKQGNAEKVWDWGATEGEEIWEDELGSAKADLVDNCNSKDRYLALKRGSI